VTLLCQPSASDVKIAVEKLKMQKSTGIDEIPAELIQAGDIAIYSEIPKKLINSVCNKKEVP
jgi:pyrrolidone-carboxylate peptidase